MEIDLESVDEGDHLNNSDEKGEGQYITQLKIQYKKHGRKAENSTIGSGGTRISHRGAWTSDAGTFR